MAVTQQHQPHETPNNNNYNNGGGNVNGVENMTSTKRQRRPSVRLGEIGDLPASILTKKPSKSPSLTKLTNWVPPKSEERVNSDDLAIGNWKIRGGSHSKRVKTNWGFTKNDDSAGPSERGYRLLQKNDDDDDDDDGGGGGGDDGGDSDGDLQHGFNLDDSSDDDDDDNLMGNEKGFDSRVAHNCKGRYGNDGVKVWLSELGLERYWPVFEIHEVDEDVLPLLTLDDLKDMGIHAVGSRRKMFCAIQKLGKVFD